MVNGGELNISINSDSADYNQRREEVAYEIIEEVTSKEEAYAVIKISDTGIGIDEGDIDKIFDPFFTTREQGTGLGLAVVYRIIESHGGFIDARSAKGKGTTFLIFLPTVENRPNLEDQNPIEYEQLNESGNSKLRI
jgi:signal transduction histidine kinase